MLFTTTYKETLILFSKCPFRVHFSNSKQELFVSIIYWLTLSFFLSTILRIVILVSQEKDQLTLQWWPPEPASPIMEAGSLRSLNAYLIKNATGACGIRHSWREEFSCLSVYLVFTRDKSFYFSTVFVPGMVLVTSSFISFWLDVNAVPARVMIGVTTMLNFCTTTNSFRSSLPVVSNLTAMNLWDFVCMIFIYASMLEFIIVNYLHRKMTRHHYYNPPAAGSRPQSAAGTESQHPAHHTVDLRLGDRGKEELEVRAPLVAGDDPSAVPAGKINHRSGQRSLTPTPAIVGGISGTPSPQPPRSSRAGSSTAQPLGDGDRVRAAASVFAWLRRPPGHIVTEEVTSQAKLARSIDHISKTVFPFLYSLFCFTFFAVFAAYLPSLLDEWIANEYREE